MYIFYLNDQEKRDQIGRQRDFCAACKAEKSTSKSVTECEISTSNKEADDRNKHETFSQ